MQKSKFIAYLLIIITILGVVVGGWVAGHILRYSIPELQQSPEHMPGEKIGEVLPPIPGRENPSQIPGKEPFIYISPNGSRVQIITREPQLSSFSGCREDTYYTSLPAKCRTLDGQLVRIGTRPQEIILIPFEEWDWED